MENSGSTPTGDGGAEQVPMAERTESEKTLAFDREFEGIAGAAHAWAYLKIGASLRARIDPSDILQETNLRAWRGFDRFDPAIAPFRRWYFRIAKNVLREAMRSASRVGYMLNGSDWSVGRLPESVTVVSARVARDESVAIILDQVEAMPQADRDTFLRCGILGETFVDAAVRLDVSPDALRMRWNRLRARIRELPEVVGLIENPEG